MDYLNILYGLPKYFVWITYIFYRKNIVTKFTVYLVDNEHSHTEDEKIDTLHVCVCVCVCVSTECWHLLMSCAMGV